MPEKDIAAFLVKIEQAILKIFGKYKISPSSIGDMDKATQIRMREIIKQSQCGEIPLYVDLVQAQVIYPLWREAANSLKNNECEELAFNISSIVYEIAWKHSLQHQLAGRGKRDTQTPLTRGLIQLIQYSIEKDEECTARDILNYIEYLSDDDSYTDLNELELELMEDGVYSYWENGAKKHIKEKSLIDRIYKLRKTIK